VTHVGEMVRHYRSEAGMTQEILARKAGVSPTTVVRLESGEIRQPRPATLRKIAAALGIEASLLAWRWPEPSAPLEPGVGPFTAVFQRDGDWWLGYVEELPGANAQEETLEEARESLREAVSLVLEANRELTRTEFEDRDVVREHLKV
jgi:transcriptional regulator with XRE-family HTH domain